MKYLLYDVYEERELLGEFTHMNSVRKKCRERDIETDNEWIPRLYVNGKVTEDWKY